MMTARLFPLALALAAIPVLAWAQPGRCPQFFPGGVPPALVNPRLAQRTTLLCNAAYAVLASPIRRNSMTTAGPASIEVT